MLDNHSSGSRRSHQPEYQILAAEGWLEIRSYGAMITAEAEVQGERKTAIELGDADFAAKSFQNNLDLLLGRIMPACRSVDVPDSSIWQDSYFSGGEAGMGLPRSNDGKARFWPVEGLTSVIGHADRAKSLRDYCLGLMMPCERKSVEPMAAITAPERTAAQHQSLLHFIGEGRWSDEKVLAKVRELVLPELERHGPIEAWIIDDTSFPKKG